MLSPNRIRSLLHEYRENEIAAIPVFKMRNGNGFTGKKTRIRGWSEFSNRLPTEAEIDSWDLNNASGIAVVLGKASNLACVDIDRVEPEALQKMQPSTYTVVGKKGEKRFFRQRHSDSEPVPHGTIITKNQFEFFLTGKYAVVEGLHSQGDNTDPLEYKFRGPKLIDADFDDIPVIDMKYVQVAENFHSVDEPIAPKDTPQLADGRFNDMKAEVAKVIVKKMSRDDSIQCLIDHDQARNPHNLFFKDRKRFPRCGDAETNAEWFIAEHRLSFAGAKKHPQEIERPKTNTFSRLFEGKEWPEPTPFTIEEHVKDISPDLIPNGFWKDFVVSQAKNVGCDLAPAFLQSLVVASSVLAGKVTIFPKKYDVGWSIYPIIWSLHVGRSGSKKSPITKRFLPPLNEMQREANEIYRERFAKNSSLESRRKKKLKRLENELDQAEEENAETAMEEISNKLNSLILEIEKDKVYRRQFKVDQITPEAMNIVLDVNASTLLARDEFSGLWKTFNKKGYETFRTNLLSAHDGEGLIYQTKANGEQFIESARLSFHSNVQPSLLEGMIRETLNDHDDGFLQRAILTAETATEKKPTDDADTSRLFKKYDIKIREVEDFDPITVTFTDTAQAHFDQYLEYIEKRTKQMTTDFLESFVGKFRGQVVKIAFLMEFIQQERGIPTKISTKSLIKAAEFLEYSYQSLLLQLKRPAYSLANELVENLKLRLIHTDTTISTLVRSCHKRFFDGPEAREAIAILEKNNYIRLEKVGKGNILRVNPHLLGEKPDTNKVKELMNGN